ncbi:MAG: methyltransferase domain-containing protein [Anaerolineales bacterium]|nr:methyltransferase domain-containing protein [Anaerolineales bacterium]
MTNPSLPTADLLHAQAKWLAPARARLLRRVAIARRGRVLDLGAGSGAVTGELVRRAGGSVTALDLAFAALRADPTPFAGAGRVCADALRLPFPSLTFDLVFCQCALLWMQPAEAVLDEIARVLRAEGALVALEPDYGGLIEHPPEAALREVWIAALARAGADPFIGRKLPGWLEARGFRVRVDLLPELRPPDPARFDFLRGLPLTEDEQTRVGQAARADEHNAGWARVAHLPFCLVTAMKMN